MGGIIGLPWSTDTHFNPFTMLPKDIIMLLFECAGPDACALALTCKAVANHFRGWKHRKAFIWYRKYDGGVWERAVDDEKCVTYELNKQRVKLIQMTMYSGHLVALKRIHRLYGLPTYNPAELLSASIFYGRLDICMWLHTELKFTKEDLCCAQGWVSECTLVEKQDSIRDWLIQVTE